MSYQNESFSSKWELPCLPPSSLELWRRERANRQLSFWWKTLILIGHYGNYVCFVNFYLPIFTAVEQMIIQYASANYNATVDCVSMQLQFKTKMVNHTKNLTDIYGCSQLYIVTPLYKYSSYLVGKKFVWWKTFYVCLGLVREKNKKIEDGKK